MNHPSTRSRLPSSSASGNADRQQIDHVCHAGRNVRCVVGGWVAMATLLPALCSAWPWPVRLLACALAGAGTWSASAPLREPGIGPVRRILHHAAGPWLLLTPRGVFIATLDHALRMGAWGWWLQFSTGGRRTWCWLSAAAPDQLGYRRLARALTARWT